MGVLGADRRSMEIGCPGVEADREWSDPCLRSGRGGGGVKLHDDSGYN